jgi:putative endonuclease
VTKERQQTGATGEQIACDFLKELGYGLVERNHRTRLSELDIIAEYEEFLVFCEVKTRKGSDGPHPSLLVTTKNLKSCVNWVNFISA